MRVFVKPGAYAFTVMPCFPKSKASKKRILCQHTEESSGLQEVAYIPAAWVKPRTANLDAVYAVRQPEPVLMTLSDES